MTRSATARLPSRITMFTNFATDSELYTGSAVTARLGGRFLRGILGLPALLACLLALCAVLRATLLAVPGASGVQGSANDVVANARQVFHAAAANQYD